MPRRPRTPAARRGRSAWWARGAILWLVLAGLPGSALAEAAGAGQVERRDQRSGVDVFADAMSRFLEAERQDLSKERRSELWTAARDGIQEVLDDYPGVMDHGEVIYVYGRRSEPFFPYYFLVICHCNLGQLDAAMSSYREVRKWVGSYPRLEGHVECVVDHCGEDLSPRPGFLRALLARDRGPCARPTEVADIGNREEGSRLARAPDRRPELCPPASPGVSAW